MHFCSQCHNMYYLKVTAEDANSLVYYCRNCGHTDNAPTTETICVSTTELKKNDQLREVKKVTPVKVGQMAKYGQMLFEYKGGF